MESIILPLLLLVPLIGALVGTLMPHARAARNWALLVSLATLGVAAWAAAVFNYHPVAGMRHPAELVQLNFGGERGSVLSLENIGFQFHLGVDSISLFLVLLTAFLTPLAIASSFESIQERAKEYYAWMLVLLATMLGVFIARDLLLFYVFFELTLIPMFFIIGIWGGPDRRYAAAKFFLFTFAGSVFTLAAVIYLGFQPGAHRPPSFDLLDVVRYGQSLPPSIKLWIALGLMAGFAVKVPLFPLHTWLPLAHTEAPTAGSVILAGVLLKLGTYGFLRLAAPIALVSKTSVAFPGLLQALGVLCVIGIIYGALVAWVQRDIKKLVAYSSVSHLGFCVLGLLALNVIGMQGSLLYMINHGLSTGALFLVVGMIYERYHTRDIDQLSGLARKMPVLASFFVLFALSSIGLPGLNGFVSEFLTILGAFTSDYLGVAFGTIAAIGVILGAIYMLHMLARVLFGPLKTPAVEHAHATAAVTLGGESVAGSEEDAHDSPEEEGAAAAAAAHAPAPGDIGLREISILVPLALAVVLLGVMPNLVLRPTLQPLQGVMRPVPPGAPRLMPPFQSDESEFVEPDESDLTPDAPDAPQP